MPNSLQLYFSSPFLDLRKVMEKGNIRTMQSMFTDKQRFTRSREERIYEYSICRYSHLYRGGDILHVLLVLTYAYLRMLLSPSDN